MITIESFAEVPVRFRGAYLAVGNFDGVHLGHAHLIDRLRTQAEAVGAPAVALTFDPRPVDVLRPGSAPPPLIWTERKVELLESAGATEVGIFRAGPWLLGLTAREFFERIVVGQFAATGMVEGPTFGFGRDRGGDAQLLGSWCAEAGLDFEIASPTIVDDRIVSSSRVRTALAEGRVAEAGALLGRPHRLRGIVVRGAGRGKGFGFPTANLEAIDVQIPLDGVYAGFAVLPNATHIKAAIHIGPNATFGSQVRTVEAHLIDYEGDLYGEHLQVELLERVRPTRKFDSVEELLTQIAADVDQTRNLLRRPSLDTSAHPEAR